MCALSSHPLARQNRACFKVKIIAKAGGDCQIEKRGTLADADLDLRRFTSFDILLQQ
ncbi:MAG: hypothetical protein IKO40_03375 [Kiritimatiellae bacterium]|nr:hypothetical protein [Kiritimatiellia bacterium]